MILTQPFDILLAHDRWATRNILVACASLTPEQFHQRFEIGPGSLHDTTTHMLGALRGWTDGLTRATTPSVRPDRDQRQRTVAELMTLQDEIATAFEQAARAEPLDTVMRIPRGDKTYEFSRGVMITHVTTHGMHHRAQCLNMLRHLGVTPLPLSSVVEWSRQVSGQV